MTPALAELLEREDVLVEIWRGGLGLVRHGPDRWVIVDSLGGPVFAGSEAEAIKHFRKIARWALRGQA